MIVTAGGRRADIQGLRGLAVLLVVAFHAGLPVPGGFVGVDVFFVISGFVITGLLLRELEATDRLDFVAFYSRRARRLLPALAIVIVAVALGAAVLLSPLATQRQMARTGAATSLLAANAELYRTTNGYFDTPAEANPLLHTWSLSVEEQFYLVFPAFLFAAWRVGRRVVRKRSPRAAVGIALLIAVSSSFGLSLLATRFDSRFAFYSSPTRAWEFAFGGLLALVAPALTQLHRSLAVAAGVGGAALIAAAAVALSGTTRFPGVAALLPVGGAGAILMAGTVPGGGVTSLLSVRPVVWLGDVSYGWYLWHWPAVVFTKAVLPNGNRWIIACISVAALGPTWLSYRWIENPIRSDVRLVGRRLLSLAAACLVVPITACLALVLSADPLLAASGLGHLREQSRVHADYEAGCGDVLPDQRRADAECTWRVANAQGAVLLVGDSNAGQFTEPVVQAANSQGLDVTVATFGGCPFVDFIVEYARPYDSKGCRRFVTAWLHAVSKLRPRLVIVASASTVYFRASTGVRFRSPTNGKTARTPEAKAGLWRQGVAGILREWDRAGIPTLLVHTVPHFPGFDMQTCPAVRLYMDACGTSLSREQVEDQQRLARFAEDRAVAGVPRASAMDFTKSLCTIERCSTSRSGRLLYRDGGHLSVGEALALTDEFAEKIRLHALPTAGSRPR